MTTHPLDDLREDLRLLLVDSMAAEAELQHQGWTPYRSPAPRFTWAEMVSPARYLADADSVVDMTAPCETHSVEMVRATWRRGAVVPVRGLDEPLRQLRVLTRLSGAELRVNPLPCHPSLGDCFRVLRPEKGNRRLKRTPLSRIRQAARLRLAHAVVSVAVFSVPYAIVPERRWLVLGEGGAGVHPELLPWLMLRDYEATQTRPKCWDGCLHPGGGRGCAVCIRAPRGASHELG